ncbi:MAG TPA: C25 family cysteine peptidase, partial [Syntrophobacteraceae bacterium]|nr:C25 family cysteine peptidase [Syntrophobacteraceae bacterium]
LDRRSIKIYEITDPRNAKEVVSFSKTHDGPPYKATFETEVAGRKTYHVTTAGAVRSPEKTAVWQPVNLKNPALEADLILIMDREFLSAVEPLCALHRDQGLRVQAVGIQDIYNEFSSGLVYPGALRDFLKIAYERWKPPAPTYVLLVGDANIDYRDYLGAGKENRVPVHLSLTESLGLTPDDNWYACVDGNDSLADMLIGRIPGSSPGAVSEEVGKIIDYEQNSSYKPRRALFVADNDQTEFETLNETLAGFLPSGFDIRKVYLRGYDNPDKATQDILSHIDLGMLVATYAGHGDVTGWAGERIFETADVTALSNADRLPFLITLDCLNGYFAQPYYYSLAEEFLIAPDKGGIASFSPSGLGYTWEHEMLGKEVYASVFKEGERRFGAITVLSKIKAYGKGMSEDLLKTFTLFGDPAGRIKSW